MAANTWLWFPSQKANALAFWLFLLIRHFIINFVMLIKAASAPEKKVNASNRKIKTVSGTIERSRILLFRNKSHNFL